MYRKYKRKGWLAGGIAVMLLILFGVLFIEIRDTSLARQNPLLLSADFLQNALDGVGEVLSNTQGELSSEALPSETAKEVQEEPGPSVTPEEAAWLDEQIASLGGGVSVYYKSLARGDTYSFDDETEYYIASVVKAPYALYVYQLADAGTVDSLRHTPMNPAIAWEEQVISKSNLWGPNTRLHSFWNIPSVTATITLF